LIYSWSVFDPVQCASRCNSNGVHRGFIFRRRDCEAANCIRISNKPVTESGTEQDSAHWECAGDCDVDTDCCGLDGYDLTATYLEDASNEDAGKNVILHGTCTTHVCGCNTGFSLTSNDAECCDYFIVEWNFMLKMNAFIEMV